MIFKMTARPLLLASLGLNVFLAVSWWVAREPLEDKTLVVPTYRPELDLKTNVVIRHENFTWDQVESTNYVTLIQNLRALGCPEQTIRDIIVTDVDRAFERRRATEVVAPDYQWWKSDPDAAAVQTATAQAQALETERERLLTTLLGRGWENLTEYSVAVRAGISLTGPVLGDLPDVTKQAALAAITQGQKKIDAYLKAQRDAGQAPDPMEMARLRSDFLMSMVPLLNPAQYEEFALRYSSGAQFLRQQMRGLDLGPDQFRAVFNALGGTASQPIYYYSGTDPELLRQQKQVQAQADTAMQTALGPQLYSIYRVAQDPVYQSSRAVAQQLGVPTEEIAPLYQINRATQAEMDRIRNDDTLSADEKVEALAQTQIDQQQSLQQLLGPDVFAKWLQAQSQSVH